MDPATRPRPKVAASGLALAVSLEYPIGLVRSLDRRHEQSNIVELIGLALKGQHIVKNGIR